ncbi:MAG: hypothetical protein ACRYG8_03065 [Janthinobacterium lividum]
MSDATSSYTSIPILGGTVREVQGYLPDEGTLQQAIQALLTGGIDRGDLSLPDPKASAAQAGSSQSSSAGGTTEATESPADEHDTRQVRTLANSTVGIAAALVGGLVASVATGGAAIPVAAAAIGTAAGAGGLTHLGFQNAADKREAGHDAQGADGTLILAAIVRDAETEAKATRILQEAGATRVETVERTGSETRLA